jgi:hypothetical protein
LAWRLLRVLLRDQVRPVIVVLALSLIASGLSLKIPDWAHIRPTGGTGAAAFGLQLPELITRTPARYLLVGEANSFLAAFVHRESKVYRTDLGAGLRQDRFDVLARARFAAASQLPLRLLSNGEGVEVAIEAARSRFGVPDEARWRCTPFSDPGHTYQVCELEDGTRDGTEPDRRGHPPGGT